MKAPGPRCRASLRGAIGSGTTPPALQCARNVHGAVDRRMPEARALATWLGQYAATLGLADAALPDDDAPNRARCRGIAAQDWLKIGAALAQAERAVSGRCGEASVDRWLGVIASTLGLDPLESRILALALRYQAGRGIERLFDMLNECRGGRTNDFHRDPALIALLLNAPAADVDARLTPEARLLASGLLRLERDGDLKVLDRLTSLVRRDIALGADLHDQLLGTVTVDPLPWEAFAHLGREAEVAAAVLRAALARRESGVNLLLYGPPGTGKTSFAATLAARIGARLRPVGEADEHGDEPLRHERLAELRLAHRLTAASNTLLLFDEAEDLFVSRPPLHS